MNAPCAWLVEHRALLPREGDALDLASGSGRHAIWLAEQGYRAMAVDRDGAALDALTQEALSRGLTIRTRIVDLEGGQSFLEPDAFDVIVVVHYLHRPLFPALRRALKPGGVLIYETFTEAQAARGRPTNPLFLLKPGELNGLVAPLAIVRRREGEFDGAMVAGVAARREA